MRKITLLFIVLFTIGTYTITHADKRSDQLLKKAVNIIKKSRGTEILLTTDGKTTDRLKIQGNKFYISSPYGETWYDGKTQWYYVADNEEVNISEPSADELILSNPYQLMGNYTQYYKTQYAGIQQGMNIIILSPKKKGEIKQIQLWIDKADKVRKLIINYNNSRQTSFIIKSYKLNQAFSANDFVFNQKKYPKAEIIDMR